MNLSERYIPTDASAVARPKGHEHTRLVVPLGHPALRYEAFEIRSEDGFVVVEGEVADADLCAGGAERACDELAAFGDHADQGHDEDGVDSEAFGDAGLEVGKGGCAAEGETDASPFGCFDRIQLFHESGKCVGRVQKVPQEQCRARGGGVGSGDDEPECFGLDVYQVELTTFVVRSCSELFEEPSEQVFSLGVNGDALVHRVNGELDAVLEL